MKNFSQTHCAQRFRSKASGRLGRPRSTSFGLAIHLLLAFCLLTFSGCGGCTNQTAKNQDKDKDEEKEKQAPKDPFDQEQPVFLPGQYLEPMRENRAKSGHWSSVQLNCVSNRKDFNGYLSTSATTGQGNKQPVAGTEFYLESTRPVSLPKEQWKYLETTLFMPYRPEASSASFELQLSDRNGLPQSLREEGIVCNLLDAHQFHFVVLTDRQASKSYLKSLDCIKLPTLDSDMRDLKYRSQRKFYHLVFNEPNRAVPLPGRSLTWTSIAYVLWDDIGPERLSLEQQTALLDWLHWGGQLIVSGPDGLAGLQDSFLADHLPCEVVQSANLTQADFTQWNRSWSVPAREGGGRYELELPGDSWLLGVELALRNNGQFVEGTGELVAESSVGRGRIVVTGFTLDNRPLLVNCKSFSGFFNTCLMRRPAREFVTNREFGLDAGCQWADKVSMLDDPLLGSRLRYVSRDLGVNGTSAEYTAVDFGSSEFDSAPTMRPPQSPNQPGDLESPSFVQVRRKLENDQYFGGFDDSPGSGVAGWNDDSAIATAARTTLLEAAGIVPPSRDFVVKMLLLYLVVLVPVNWLVFRLLGRVELAWVAAPIIAVVGAVAVVRYASLDIGFVRSSSSVGVLELHGGYSRGHLSNYTALYTSLSTNYDVVIRDGSALVLPLAKQSGGRGQQRLRPVQFKIGRDIEFNNFPIDSNSTRLFHSENMVDVGGAIYLDAEDRLHNESTLVIHDVVVARNRQGSVQVAWLDAVDANSDTRLQWQEIELAELRDQWDRSPQMYSNSRHARQIVQEVKRRAKERRAEGQGGLSAAQVLEEENRTSFEYEEVIAVIGDDPETSDKREEYVRAVQNCPSISPTDRASFPELVLSEQQIADICQLANDELQLRLGSMLDQLTDKLQLKQGQTRLIGWADGTPGQSSITPAATQQISKTMVLVHLSEPRWQRPARDRGAYADYAGLLDDDEDLGVENVEVENVEVDGSSGDGVDEGVSNESVDDAGSAG